MLRFSPRYPKQPQIEEVLRYLRPGLDEFVNEKYAEHVENVLGVWSTALKRFDFNALRASLSPTFKGTSWLKFDDKAVRNHPKLEVARREFKDDELRASESFLSDFRRFFGDGKKITVAEFWVPDLKAAADSRLETTVRYNFVLEGPGPAVEQHVGYSRVEWQQSQGALLIASWKQLEETASRSERPLFTDITHEVFGAIPSYQQQLVPGTDYWRTVLDQASGIDVYGNNGIAAGDIDGDGFDEIYICQPSGLPNRLYRNTGDSRFEDITDKAGIGVLDNTPCALFADIDNDGHQDLLVVTAHGPVLFVNKGDGTFASKEGAFHFQHGPEGTFTGAAFGDYDRDGFLDVYFCLYSYYKGLDQYQYPRPYYNAVNGPPKFLFRNRGDRTFEDVTERAGLNQDNNHYGFDCTWCDFDDDGWPDLYVVNDFGSKNLYRNNRDGTFTDVAEESGVLDVGPGMSSCWLDSRSSAREDLYVSDMWEPAGLRVSSDPAFMKDEPDSIRALYRRHAKGNSLYRNTGAGRFEDSSARAGMEQAGWSWSSDAWDFDHDGYPDLYVTNGMISGADPYDCESFFWRQVVARSPEPGGTSKRYELGWGAINDLIRADASWAGHQRNIFYLNTGDGTFSEISGLAGLDFIDDSRAFALSDIDHDGRLELFLKGRTGPQVRVLRNQMPEIGNAIAVRLRGTGSNRDAVGAAVIVECEGRRHKKLLRAGTGFVSQHTKELFFGLGTASAVTHLHVRWPNGASQDFQGIPANHRVEITQGQTDFKATPFAVPREQRTGISPLPARPVDLPPVVETWLIDPVAAPEIHFQDVNGRAVTLGNLRGHNVFLYFWTLNSDVCRSDLAALSGHFERWRSLGLELVALNLDGADRQTDLRQFAEQTQFPFAVLSATDEVGGVYNLLFRYLFDRRRNLGFPTSFLVNKSGEIVKVYQGALNFDHLAQDITGVPANEDERLRAALPFPGRAYKAGFSRSYFTYGTAYFQAGYLDQALASFQSVIARAPDDAVAHYSIGTIYLQKNEPERARPALERALELRNNYPDALNDLGLLAARSGRSDEAQDYFNKAIALKPDYVIALENLGRLYRTQAQFAKAEDVLDRALKIEPANAELNYDLGMVFAMQGDDNRARTYLQQATSLQPDYAEAWNNLGVLSIKSGQTNDALKAFEQCVRVAPDYAPGYLNVARVYVSAGDKEKALDALRELLRRHPDNAEAAAELARLNP